MKSKEEVIERLRQARPQLAREFGVTRVAVFGSYARGEQRADSDVDVLVEVDPSIGLRFVDLADRIEAILGVRADVVSRRAISPRHWTVIERKLEMPPRPAGILLEDRRRVACHRTSETLRGPSPAAS